MPNQIHVKEYLYKIPPRRRQKLAQGQFQKIGVEWANLFKVTSLSKPVIVSIW